MAETVRELTTGVTAAASIGTYLADQRHELHANDPRVRRGEPDSVHDLRVATRRVRSVLATYRPLLDRSSTGHLGAELKWFAAALGQARDAEILHARMIEIILEEPPGAPLDTVRRRVDAELLEVLDLARGRTLAAMESARYHNLLDELSAFDDDTPCTDEAFRPATEVLPPLIRKEWKRLRHAGAEVGRASGEQARAELLHEVRKSAKRVRYAAEVAQPVFGDPARSFVQTLAHLQTVLGDSQDSVVTLHGIRSLAAHARLSGEDTFVYGRLDAREEARSAQAGKDYSIAWEHLTSRRLRRWFTR